MTEDLRVQIILNEMDRQWTQAKQCEDQRSTMSNFIIAVALAAQGFIVEKDFPTKSLVIAVILCVLGIFGMIACAKYYERFRQCASRIGRLRESLDAMDPLLGLDSAELAAKEKHIKKHKLMIKIPLNKIWIILMLTISLLGIFDVAMILKFGK